MNMEIFWSIETDLQSIIPWQINIFFLICSKYRKLYVFEKEIFSPFEWKKN